MSLISAEIKPEYILVGGVILVGGAVAGFLFLKNNFDLPDFGLRDFRFPSLADLKARVEGIPDPLSEINIEGIPKPGAVLGNLWANRANIADRLEKGRKATNKMLLNKALAPGRAVVGAAKESKAGRELADRFDGEEEGTKQISKPRPVRRSFNNLKRLRK